jgi:aspartate/methionine/tyrosine aminotransferase
MTIQPAHRTQHVQEYYFANKLNEIKRLAASRKPIINLGVGNPDLPPPPAVIRTLKTFASQKDTHGYQPYTGLPELREAIAKFYHKHYKVTLNKTSQVLPLAGSKEGIQHLTQAYVNPEDIVLIPDPGYTTYTAATLQAGGKPNYYSLNAHNPLPDFKALEKIDLSKVKIMWVNYPHMPTGVNITHKEFEEILAFGRKHHIIIAHDNPYSFILTEKPQSILSVAKTEDHVIELNSLSKTFNMAGWRVGWMAGNSEIIKQTLKIKSNMDSGMFYPLQMGAIAALQTDTEWFHSQNNEYVQRQKLVLQMTKKLNLQVESNTTGLFVWAKIQSQENSKTWSDNLLYDKHIFVAPGHIFGKQGERYVRFSLCVPQEKIQEALNRL